MKMIPAFLAGIASAMLTTAVRADTFAQVYYSARTDQLVVTMDYRGTNPGHTFSVKRGQCHATDDGGSEVAAELLDSQADDIEQKNFKKTTRFSLADIPCRPATVTLRSAPRFLATLRIPASPRSQH